MALPSVSPGPKRRWRPLRRSLDRFATEPVSVRNAIRVIVVTFATTVLISGMLVWLLDSREFPNLGVGLWWALQTVTTVGYGDVTPRATVGRVVGGAVMLTSIAFVSVITAAITSSFVERARREWLLRGSAAEEDDRTIEVALARISERLERIEQALSLFQ